MTPDMLENIGVANFLVLLSLGYLLLIVFVDFVFYLSMNDPYDAALYAKSIYGDFRRYRGNERESMFHYLLDSFAMIYIDLERLKARIYAVNFISYFLIMVYVHNLKINYLAEIVFLVSVSFLSIIATVIFFKYVVREEQCREIGKELLEWSKIS